MLSTERPITKHRNHGKELMTTKSALETTYLIEMATSPKSSLWGPGRQVNAYIRAIRHGNALQLSRILRKRLVFSLPGLHGWATNPTQFRQAIEEHTERMIRGTVIPPIAISGQKRLSPYPTSDRAATVYRTVLVTPSRNFGASF